MHLLSDEQAQRPVIDEHRACDALAELPTPEAAREWAQRFGLLADLTRLTLLLCIHNAGSISVTDLATASALKEATVSQSLRLMRAHDLVTTERDGRVSATSSPTSRCTTCFTRSWRALRRTRPTHRHDSAARPE